MAGGPTAAAARQRCERNLLRPYGQRVPVTG
jgi:hypothetical protein